MDFPLERSRAVPKWFEQVGTMVRHWPWPLMAVLGGLGLLLTLALLGYQAGARPVTLDVDGQIHSLHTHQRLVGGVLEQAGLVLGPGDQVWPPPDAPWPADRPIVVRRALDVTIHADGREAVWYGRPHTALEVLAHSGVYLQENDLVYVNGIVMPGSAYADEAALLSHLPRDGPAHPATSPALQIEVVRAVPIYVHDDGIDLELRTTAETAGQALEAAGLPIYQADRVYPPLDTPVQAGLHLYIARALPVSVTADGRTYIARTWSETVAELLQEQGLEVGPLDRLTPAAAEPLRPDTSIRLVRVTTLDLFDTFPISYTHRQEADPDMELDSYRLQQGLEGIRAEVTRVTFEDGCEADREFLGEQVIREPVDEVFYYGTKIVLRTMDTPHGPIEYWRKFRVWATHYYPSTCDKEPDHPEYGITYTGKWATRGIIAVDPRVIPLHTRMYVPGYGHGAAEDIGGAIKGRHIDVCFDDADIGKGLWSTRYVDVYLLLPLPPEHKIPWILP